MDVQNSLCNPDPVKHIQYRHGCVRCVTERHRAGRRAHSRIYRCFGGYACRTGNLAGGDGLGAAFGALAAVCAHWIYDEGDGDYHFRFGVWQDSSFTFADERMGNSSTMGTYYCFWLFIYGFLVLIAMITIFNIINSISMSVSARLKQYGAFRAIGVSMGQLSKMIVAEAFTYTIIGGVVGTVLGLFCNKLLFGMLISYRWGDAWTPPLPEVAVILLIVVSSVILAVHGPIKRIRNMSIVDTISAQ